MFRLQIEMDDEPAYIFGPNQSDDDEPLITIIPGKKELATLMLHEALNTGEVLLAAIREEGALTRSLIRKSR